MRSCRDLLVELKGIPVGSVFEGLRLIVLRKP